MPKLGLACLRMAWMAVVVLITTLFIIGIFTGNLDLLVSLVAIAIALLLLVMGTHVANQEKQRMDRELVKSQESLKRYRDEFPYGGDVESFDRLRKQKLPPRF